MIYWSLLRIWLYQMESFGEEEIFKRLFSTENWEIFFGKAWGKKFFHEEFLQERWFCHFQTETKRLFFSFRIPKFFFYWKNFSRHFFLDDEPTSSKAALFSEWKAFLMPPLLFKKFSPHEFRANADEGLFPDSDRFKFISIKIYYGAFLKRPLCIF